jgi:MFS family permease
LRGFLALTAVFSGMALANWIGYTWLPLYLHERFHVSLAVAGFTGTFYIQAGSVAGILLGGQLSDRWILRTGRGRLFTQALALTVAAPSLFLAGSASWLPLLIAALVLFGIGRGMFDANAMPVLCQFASPELRSTGYGVFISYRRTPLNRAHDRGATRGILEPCPSSRSSTRTGGSAITASRLDYGTPDENVRAMIEAAADGASS